jgi:hypothetical protein
VSLRISDDEHDRPVDLTALAEDDRLLDQLGRGERPDSADGHDVNVLLSDWRASLPAPDPADDRLLAASVAALRRPHRAARRTLVVAASALVALGGMTAAAENAGPGSLLWPITQLVYGDLAESRTVAQDASDTVAAARVAIGSGDYDRAARLLAQAATLTDRIAEPEVAADLRTRIATTRDLLPTPTEPLPDTVSSVPPAPSAEPPAELSVAPPADPPPDTSTEPPTQGKPPSSEPTHPTEPPGLLPSLPVEPPDPADPTKPSVPRRPPLN